MTTAVSGPRGTGKKATGSRVSAKGASGIQQTRSRAQVRVRQLKHGESISVRFNMDGKRPERSFDTREHAEAWKLLVDQEGPEKALLMLDAEELTAAVSSHTVDELMKLYNKSRTGAEDGTLEHYEMFARTSISPFMGALPAHMVTREKITEWVEAESESGRASKTIKNRLGYLAGVFNFAVDEELLTKNPCRGVRIQRGERRPVVFLTVAQFDTIISYLEQNEQDAVLMLAHTGIRWGELTALTVDDIDLEKLTVSINKAWKRSKKRGWYIGPPKTKKGVREISFSENLVPMLLRLIAVAQTVGKRRGTKRSEMYLFTNRQNNPLRGQRFLAGYWNPALRLANGLAPFDTSNDADNNRWQRGIGAFGTRTPAASPIGKFPRIHDLRHTHASWLLEKGATLHAIQYRLGHESIKTTVDIYGHRANALSRAEADIMTSLFSAGDAAAGADATPTPDERIAQIRAARAALEAEERSLMHS